MMQDEQDRLAFSITIDDRFGGFALVNIVIARRQGRTLEVDTSVMSCRVLQRGVEQLALNKVFEGALRMGCDRAVGRYIPSCAPEGVPSSSCNRCGRARHPPTLAMGAKRLCASMERSGLVEVTSSERELRPVFTVAAVGRAP
jgi:hypothetical protein